MYNIKFTNPPEIKLGSIYYKYIANLSPVQKKSLRFESKSHYDFDRNQNRRALSKERTAKGKNRENLNQSNTYGF